jgi:hypothetical protein
LRQEGEQGWFSATFTPRGKQHWTYFVFGQTNAQGRLRRPNTALFRARNKDNPFLPDEFYETVKQQYSSVLTAQELEGEFTNLEGALFRRHWFPPHCRPGSGYAVLAPPSNTVGAPGRGEADRDVSLLRGKRRGR